jgi:dienelactone hydrolase
LDTGSTLCSACEYTANGIMQAIVYPDAYHSFDAASGIEKPHSAYGHLLAYNPAATADARRGYLNFYIDICTDVCSKGLCCGIRAECQ